MGTVAYGDVGAGIGTLAEVAALYEAQAGRVRQLVRANVRAPEAVIEDACQIAWSRLVRHRTRVARETAVAWLVRTAVREAFKLIRREGREVSLDALLEHTDEPALGVGPSVERVVEQRERLDCIRRLPTRQQRLVWLQGLGLSYAEMASHTGATTRTVERQLLRAKRALVNAEV